MEISKKQLILAFTGVVLVALALGIFWRTASKQMPAGTNTEQAATSTSTSLEPAASSTPQAAVSVGPFPINAADNITSWIFKGQYVGSEVLIKQANDDIAHLKSLIGKGQYDDYDLYDGIANDYSSLGDGKLAYQNYNRAIAIHPKKGLAYVNLAHCMEGLGAYYTAADAYTAAVKGDPGQLEYHIERLTYLTERFGSDTTVVSAAFADASKQFGDTPAILSIEAKWLTEQKRYTDAIKAWETVKMLSPESRQAAIDEEIARLKTKQ